MDIERGRSSLTSEVLQTLLKARKASTNAATYNRVWPLFQTFALDKGFFGYPSGHPQCFRVPPGRIEAGAKAHYGEESDLGYFCFHRSEMDSPRTCDTVFFALSVKPARHMLFPKWDLLLVLEFLNSDWFNPAHSPTLLHITLKTAFLVAS